MEAPPPPPSPDSKGGESRSSKDLSGSTASEITVNAAARLQHRAVKPASLRSMFRYASRWDTLFIVLGIIGAVANGVSMPIFAVLFGDLMNSFGLNIYDPNALKDSVRSEIPKFLYLGVGAACAAFIQTFFLVFSSVRQANRMRAAYLRAVLVQEIGYFDTQGTSGVLMQCLNEDCSYIQSAIGEKLSMLIFMLSTAVAGIIVAFTKGWLLTLVVLALLPLLAGTGFAMSILINRITSSMNRAYSEANSIAQQTLSNVRTIYAFNGEERSAATYDGALQAPLKVGIRQGIWSGITTGMANIVAYCGYALAMWYGARKVAQGEYNGGEVLNVLLAALIGGFALGQSVNSWQGVVEGRASTGRLFSILDRPSQISAEAAGQEPKAIEGQLELRDVVFAYPSRPEKPVFNGFSLTVPAGKTVALVGESGSGKSTVVQLIERFYDPQQGAVLLDGIDLRSLQLRWLRSQMGLVSQEPTLFATTIRENILFGKPGSTEAEVIEAAKGANAHTFISGLPRGYDTHVGEKGVQMSGGQKQRIAIARAILKDPKVLLLDEATSALDSESEHIVQDALDKLMVGRTTVVVAHRLSTVRDADMIAVVKKGQVIEQGRHEELVATGGAYATLVHMQQSSAEEQQDSSKARPTNSVGALSLAEEGDGSGEEMTAVGEDANVPGVLDEAVEVVKSTMEVTKEVAETAVASGLGIPMVAPTRLASGLRQFLSFRKKQEAPAAENYSPALPPTPADTAAPVKVPLRRLASLNGPELPAAFGGLLGSAVLGMLMPIFSFAFSSLIGVFYLSLPSEVESGARKWSLVFTGIGFAALFAAVLQAYCFNFMGQRLGWRVRVMMMRSLLRQEVGWYDKEENSSGVLTSKLSADALAVKGQFGDTMGLITQNMVTLFAGYIIAGVYSWRMMLVVTAMMPFMAAAAIIQSKLILAYVSGERDTFAAANATAAEAFSSIRTVAAFGMEGQVVVLYERQLKVPTTRARGRIISSGAGFGFFQFVMYATIALAFWFAGIEVSEGRSSFVDILKAFFAIFLASFSASQAQLHFPDVAKGRAAVQRVFSIIDRSPKIDASDPGGVRPIDCSGEIVLRNVNFAYPMRPDAPVFRNFNLTVPAGATVALVGESGSGKSTVVQLIERFYDPHKGAVLLDGVDIKTLNLHWLRSNIGLVSQEPVLFNMSVAENIRYGRQQASLEDVVAAAKAANAHTFIEALPEGYDTMLGEGAIQLSGGQKQRIAIARAVVKDPKILLLDEATSALDAESEHVVQEALERLMVGRTTVVVAHRLSTIRDADSIAVVFKGQVVEQGRHEALVAGGGAYARLVARQNLAV